MRRNCNTVLKVVLYLSLLICMPIQSAQIVLADAQEADEKSFTFSVLPHVFDASTGTFFIAAQQTGGNDFTIARANRASNFTGLSPYKVNFNGLVEQINPLRGKKINHIALLENELAVVADDVPAQLFLQRGTSFIFMVSTHGINLHDAAGADAADIVGLSTKGREFIFAAVSPNGASFGDANSGIALVQRQVDTIVENKGNKEKERKISTVKLNILDATTGISEGNKAVRLDPTTDEIKIGSDLAALGSVVSMHWDAHLQRLYVGLQPTASAGVTDGARSVLVGRVEDNKLVFSPIAPGGLFSAANKIVGATGASVQVSAHKIKTMRTSTLLSYLIISGGNGAPNATGNTVFALPLIDKNTGSVAKNFDGDSQHGTLAVAASSPTSFYANSIASLTARAFTTVLEQAADALTTSDTQAQVGAGALPLDADQIITDMQVIGDAVFVSISTAFGGSNEPGIFHSQAIFDEQGRVVAWTPWRRVAGTDEQIYGLNYDSITGDFWYLPGTASTTVDTLKRTLWGDGAANGLLGGTTTDASVGLVQLVSKELPKINGGVQGLFDFPNNTPGFGNTEKLSLAVATGLNKLMLIETGRDSGGSFRQNKGNFSSVTAHFTQGAITQTFANSSATKVIILSGGELDDLGALITAEVATDGTDGWLFIGGSDGLGVLMESDGSGWLGDLYAGFGGLTAGMAIKKIGDYSFVRKLMADGDYLYVLTNTTFDRIDLTTSNFATGVIDVTVLARVGSMPFNARATFSDVLVSDSFALLATSTGLLRVGNGRSVNSDDLNSINWTRVDIGTSLGPVTRLLATTTTGHEQDFSTTGQVLALNAYVGFNNAQINRFYVNVAGAIDDNSMLPLPDFFFKDAPIFFVTFGAYRNFIAVDGSVILNSRSVNGANEPFLGRLPNRRLSGPGQNILVNWADSLRVGKMVRNSGSGSWLVPGDLGLRVNE